MANMCCSSPVDHHSSEQESSTSSAGSVSDQLEATADLSSDEEFFMYQFKASIVATRRPRAGARSLRRYVAAAVCPKGPKYPFQLAARIELAQA